MRTRLLPALSALAALAGLELTSTAAAAPPLPFGAPVLRRHSRPPAAAARRCRARLNGNGPRFRAGPCVRVDILGRDAPTYRPSNGTFRVDVSRLRVTLPARERRPR